uniref:Uncharacterized protein n=1 Tax=Ixodes ricinus TaxID=34613 RepID=A0A147BB52_IXORI
MTTFCRQYFYLVLLNLNSLQALYLNGLCIDAFLMLFLCKQNRTTWDRLLGKTELDRQMLNRYCARKQCLCEQLLGGTMLVVVCAQGACLAKWRTRL